MFKNVTGQKITVSAVNYTTGALVSGDSANITVYVSKDDGSVTALGDTSATEADATNAKGDYLFDLTQGETNADKLRFTGKSTTSNVIIVPQTIYTTPASFTSFTTPPTAAQNATAVWQDTTAGDFTVASSIGKSLYTSGAAPGAANGLLISGSNSGTTTFGALTVTGAVTFSSTFGVSGATTLTGLTTGAFSCTTLTASGAVAFQSTFAVTTSTSLAALSCSTLTASGAVAFQSTFGVTGTTSLAALTTSGTVTFNAFTVTNNFTVSGNWLTTGTTTLTGAVSYGSTFAITGNLTAANLTNARIGYLDNINNSSLAAAAFPTDPADESLIIAATDAIMTRLGTPAGASVSADIAEIEAETDDIAAVKAKTDNLPASPAAVGSAMTLTSSYDFAKGTAAMTESYNADGAAPTPSQALMLIMQALTEGAISGTTWTIKKLDGSTTAATVTLDSATAPTSKTRAT